MSAVAAPRRSILLRLAANPMSLTAMIVIAVLVAISFLAPWIAPFDPNKSNLSITHLPPFQGPHILGTDSIGRDVLSRLIWGGQITFIAAFVASLTAILTGVPLGLAAGYWGGMVDTVATWLMNLNMAIPGTIIILAVRAAFGPDIVMLMAVMGVLGSPAIFRVTRSSVAFVRTEGYVDAARVLGLSDLRIILRHVLFAVRSPIIVQGSLIAAIAILTQSGLEFLGLGDLRRNSWGSMLNDGFRNVYVNPVLLIWPSLAISSVVALLVLFGNALRDELELVAKPNPIGRRKALPAPVVANPGSAPVVADSGSLLTVGNLTVSYDGSGETVKVVDGVSFDVGRGEVLGIVGESGSGKTQTAFAVLGLLPAAARLEAGALRFDGVDLFRDGVWQKQTHRSLLGRGIAYVPQEPTVNLDPAFRIGYQLVRPMMVVSGLSGTKAKRRALDLLAQVGIHDPDRVYNAYPHEISGGMAQRVLIAGAISCSPRLLIADEPTTALDVTVQAEILDLLRDLQSRMGMSLIMVSHNMGVIADLCQRVVVMRNAQVVEVDSVQAVLTAPKHPYTRQLIGALLVNKTPRTLLLGQESAR
jgi:ABC-type dipeptide/oligopeptide/nickel transport system ATPase component/ABC-type dipeptide/oligopeptide/nickel transport system permease subunit